MAERWLLRPVFARGWAPRSFHPRALGRVRRGRLEVGLELLVRGLNGIAKAFDVPTDPPTNRGVGQLRSGPRHECSVPKEPP